MRKLILSLIVLLSVPAFADAHGYNEPRHHHPRGAYGMNWLAPAIIGGALTYSIMRPAPPTVIYAPPQPYGNLPAPPYGYHWDFVFDGNCACNRLVLLPN
jgi:hypothetical protein